MSVDPHSHLQSNRLDRNIYINLGLTDSNGNRITPKKVVLLTPGYPGVNTLLIRPYHNQTHLLRCQSDH